MECRIKKQNKESKKRLRLNKELEGRRTAKQYKKWKKKNKDNKKNLPFGRR